MTMFRGTVRFYRQYRPGIPAVVADLLDRSVIKDSPRRLLDVGTGTGLVVEALLDRFDDIIAIDNNAEMLKAANEAIRPKIRDGTELRFEEVTAEEFVPPLKWQADLVTICRAFHWLDQATVLAKLDGCVNQGGAVAIFGDSSIWAATSPWKASVRSLIQSFLGEQRRAGKSTFKHHNRSYSDIMRESSFAQVEEYTIPVTRTWSAASILGYLYSTSFAAPHLFGERLDEFEQAMIEMLASFSSTDEFVDENEFSIHIGRRAEP